MKLILMKRYYSYILLIAAFALSNGRVKAQVNLVLNQPNTGGIHVASQSILLTDGFSAVPGFHAYISSLANCVPIASVPSSNQNYILTTIPRQPFTDASSLGSKNVCEVMQGIQYFDGLGRPLQTVQVKGSALADKDVVVPMAYDEFGREAVKYLPYASGNNDGSYKASALSEVVSYYQAQPVGQAIGFGTPFSKTVFEPSPLNRVLEQGAPGNAWQPVGNNNTGHTLKTEYGSNTANDVKLWTVTTTGATAGYYEANKLYKTTIKDENWTAADAKAGTTDEYKDFEGRVVLKRVWETGTKGLSTYYVYDDFGNLRYVLPPAVNENSDRGSAVNSFSEADEVFKQFIYGYHYDGRKRVIEKKIPGKGWENMVYNKLDQVVFTQDARQQTETIAGFTPGQYHSFNKYDALGRLVISGIERNRVLDRGQIQVFFETWQDNWEVRSDAAGHMHGYSNLSIPQNAVDMDVQVVNYYDNYHIPGLPNNQSAGYSGMTQGLLTATKTKVLGTTDHYLWTVNYYNDRGEVARVWQQHYKGGVVDAGNYDEITNAYTFIGELKESTRKHYVGGVESLYVKNEYEYDHMGRKTDSYQVTGNTSSTTANSRVLLARNVYNETGQLLTKSLHSTDSGNSFAEHINYSYNERGWLSSQQASPLVFSQSLKYNEAVSGVAAQYNGNISRQEWTGGKSYNYSYDKLNRLTAARASTGNDEELGYDVMGNISSLLRKQNNSVVDQIGYTYNQGNMLASVLDNSASTAVGFQPSGATSYSYDVNGNMTGRTSASSAGNNLYDMVYNPLNLPSSINANGAMVGYTYGANGTKLKKLVTGAANINNEYISGIHYENGAFAFAQTEAGRVTRNGSGADPVYLYEYTVSDHLGNGRMYFDISGGVARKIQETDYYAFGLAVQAGAVLGNENKHQYNGKEKQDQEKMYDYGARFYDPVIGRWNVVDPLSEISRRNSPYGYALNNPMRFIDVDGMYADDPPSWLKRAMDFFGISTSQPKSQEQAIQKAEGQERLSRVAANNEAIEKKLDKLEYVPVVGAISKISKGSIKQDNTIVAAGVGAGLLDAFGGKIATKVTEKVMGPALRKLVGEGIEAASQAGFKDLQVTVKSSAKEMNAFFTSKGEVLPSRSVLESYKDLAERIVTGTGGAPSTKLTEASLKVQTSRINMINEALKKLE